MIAVVRVEELHLKSLNSSTNSRDCVSKFGAFRMNENERRPKRVLVTEVDQHILEDLEFTLELPEVDISAHEYIGSETMP